MAWKEGKDLFLFNSGDIVDGTGLSDATQVRGVLITPIIQQMPFTGTFDPPSPLPMSANSAFACGNYMFSAAHQELNRGCVCVQR